MAFRTLEIREISFEIEKKRQQSVVEEINELYPDLTVELNGKTVTVKGDFHNYKKHDMIIYILSGGEHGENIYADEHYRKDQSRNHSWTC